VSEGLFDIKNDRRLSMYLYRIGFGVWLVYLVLGAPAMSTYVQYRTDCGILCFVLMIVGFSASMVYDYSHHKEVYEQKKKWLFISYIILAGIIYFFVFNGKQNLLSLNWLFRLI
jgi:4-hydroxybenzoate polyprenyltransferase